MSSHQTRGNRKDLVGLSHFLKVTQQVTAGTGLGHYSFVTPVSSQYSRAFVAGPCQSLMNSNISLEPTVCFSWHDVQDPRFWVPVLLLLLCLFPSFCSAAQDCFTCLAPTPRHQPHFVTAAVGHLSPQHTFAVLFVSLAGRLWLVLI